MRKTTRMLLTAPLMAAVMLQGNTAAAADKLTLYCSPQIEWCQLMVSAFEEATGIKVAMTRKSSGETFAQIKAESRNPKGDVWWGGTGDPHLQAAEEGLTEKYDSPMLPKLHDWAQRQNRDSGGRTVGIYAGALGFGYNKDLLAKHGLPTPACWKDLLKPEFKGHVQMANPNSSGTAYTTLATIVQIFGEDEGFEFMKGLHRNINQYTKSGSAPIKAAARGETTVGIVFQHDIVTQVLQVQNVGAAQLVPILRPLIPQNGHLAAHSGSNMLIISDRAANVTQVVNGFPIAVVSPCEGTGYEIGSMSIIKGARNLDSAKKFYDFALGADIQERAAQAKAYQVPSNASASPPPQAPDLASIKLIDYDFKKYGSSTERKRLLAKWDAEVKSLPR